MPAPSLVSACFFSVLAEVLKKKNNIAMASNTSAASKE